MEKRDLYAEVTQKVIAQLEIGCAPWVKPWKSAGAPTVLPVNYLTKRAYRGINVLLLWGTTYQSNAWMTFKQAKSIGAHVRRGERGTMIVFYKPFRISEVNAKGEKVEKTIPLLRAFTVFNVAQIDGLPESQATVAPSIVSNFPAADATLSQADISHGGDRAFYSPALDGIRMPHKAAFASEAEYYATALHELTHWTGHPSRCARTFGKSFGDEAYAREELVAEIGAAFLCAAHGIEGRLQHAEYIASWIKVLKSDKRAVVAAASMAQKAADFVLNAAPIEAANDEEDDQAAPMSRAA